MKEGYNFEYIPIDISHDANLVLAENMKKNVENLNMTLITALFEEGVEWVFKNKKERNVYFILGSTLGNNNDAEIHDFFKWISTYMKKGDKFVVGVDMMKDPYLIQRAYFNELGLENRFIMNNLSRINNELEGTFDLDKFYPHTYFNPETKSERACIISKEDQTVKVHGKEYHFDAYETIEVLQSRKFTQEDLNRFGEQYGNMKTLQHFDDEKKYMRVCIYEKN